MMTNYALETNEFLLEIPVWVNGKRKWVTGITKKTTFDDLIYALLMQADLLESSEISNNITGYAIAECVQSMDAILTQRILKGRSKVIKVSKSWQFDQLPLTVLHLISIDNHQHPSSSSSATKFRSKIFRRFLPSKDTHRDNNSHHQKLLHTYQENAQILERQKRLLDYLDEKIHQAEKVSTPKSSDFVVTLNDVSQFLSSKPIEQEQLILATQLCNSIFNLQEHIDEKLQLTNAVEQAISNELNHVCHQQHYDALPIHHAADKTTVSNDFNTLKNSIHRSRELSRMQSKEMHDLDLSLRESEILLGSKYDQLKYLQYETASNIMTKSKSLSSHVRPAKQINMDEAPITYDTFDIALNSMKEMDDDSGINSLTSEDSNHHSMPLNHSKNNTQLETLV